MIYAIDFDGTLCSNAWPDIGEPNTEVIRFLKREQANGAELILWTMREGETLEKNRVCAADYGAAVHRRIDHSHLDPVLPI